MTIFGVVPKTYGFKRLTFEMLHQFVMIEDIRVMKEEEIFEAVIGWVKADFEDWIEKENQLYDLLQEICFPLISPSYLGEVVQKDELIRKNRSCYGLVTEGKDYNLPNTDIYICIYIFDNKLTRPRKCMGVV